MFFSWKVSFESHRNAYQNDIKPLFTDHLLICCPSSGLRDLGLRRFQRPAVNYSTVLLEAERQRLYVGARGAVFALNSSNIEASSALTVSLFCSHVDACSAPRLPIPQSSNGVICILAGRNKSASFGGRTIYSSGFSYFHSFKIRIFLTCI